MLSAIRDSSLSLSEVFIVPYPIASPGSDQIPAGDANLSVFADQFASAFTAQLPTNPAPTPAQVSNAAVAFSTVLALASAGATRTPVTVAAKDASRATLVTLLRSALSVILGDYKAGELTAIQLTIMGVRVPSDVRTPSAAPSDAPLFAVDSLRANVVAFRVTQVVDSLPVTARAFPAGVASIEIWSRVGVEPWAWRAVRRAVNIELLPDFAASGTLVSWRARYLSPRGLPGPFSSIVESPVWRTL